MLSRSLGSNMRFRKASCSGVALNSKAMIPGACVLYLFVLLEGERSVAPLQTTARIALASEYLAFSELILAARKRGTS